MKSTPPCNSRRDFLAFFSAAGLSSTLFPGVLYAMTQDRNQVRVTSDMIREAEQIAGLSFTDKQRQMMERGLAGNLGSYARLRAISLPNSVSPALYFDPVPPPRRRPAPGPRKPVRVSEQDVPEVPGDLEELAFWPVTRLSKVVQSGAVTSVELTEMYLERLKRYDEKLQYVITLTEDLAMQQAEQADREIEAGEIRGPLHGTPWGAKDLRGCNRRRTCWPWRRPFRTTPGITGRRETELDG